MAFQRPSFGSPEFSPSSSSPSRPSQPSSPIYTPNSPFPLEPELLLPIFPPSSNLKFRFPSDLLIDSKDRVLLDNLWANRTLQSFPQIMKVLVQHFHVKNTALMMREVSHISLRPQMTQTPGLEAYVNKERMLKAKEVEYEELKKELLKEKQKREERGKRERGKRERKKKREKD